MLKVAEHMQLMRNIEYSEETKQHMEHTMLMELCHNICYGDSEKAIELLRKVSQQSKTSLSKDKLRNAKNKGIIFISLITRYCIDVGHFENDFYNLGDYFINEIEEAQEIKQINDILSDSVEIFSQKFQEVRSNCDVSRVVSQCVNYIYNNLQSEIKLEKVSEYLGISPQYLSKKFKQEMNVSFSEFVNRQKVEAASRMILQANADLSEISSAFCFSSQSHFTQIFKKYKGMTPGTYKNCQAKL